MYFSGFSCCFPPGKPGKWYASLLGLCIPSHEVTFFIFSFGPFNTVFGRFILSYYVISLVFQSQTLIVGILKVVCVWYESVSDCG